MSWSAKKSDSRMGPENKKRKLEFSHQGAADDWDDDIAFTQEELNTLDVIASQAIQQSQPPQAEKTPAPRLSTFSIPGTRSKYSHSSSSKESQLFQPSSSRSAGPPLTHHSSSEELSSNGYKAPPKLDTERTKEERDRYAGEVKYLKDVTRSQEAELEKLRAQIEEIKEGHKITETTKIQSLETVVERVTFEKQFKDREIEELQRQLQSVQQKLRRLEVQNHKNQQQKSNGTIVQKSPEKVSPKKVPVQPSPPSRKQQKLIENIPMSQQQHFPTYHSFIKQTASQGEVQTRLPTLPGASPLEPTSTTSTSRRLKLNIGRSKSKDNLIAIQLFHASQVPSELKNDMKMQIWDPGLIRLLNDASFSSVIGVLGSKRNDDSFVPRRKFPGAQTKQKPGEWKPQIVTREHYQLAVDGLMFLLDERTTLSHDNQAASRDSRKLPALPEIYEEETVYKLMNSTEETFLKEQTPTCRALTNILPLLTDYIQHYVHVIEAESFRLNKSSSSLSSSNFSSPPSLETTRYSTPVLTESSPGSLGGCLTYLLRGEKGLCGSEIESLTTLSIRTLAKLLFLCRPVGQVIFKQSVSFCYTTMMSAKELAEDMKKRSSSSSGNADDEQSSRSSETLYLIESHIPAFVSRGKAPSLLQSLLRLARQDLEHDCTNPVIVNKSVKCLTNLIHCLPKQVLYKLEGLLPLHFVSAIFKQSRCISVHLSALKLLGSLARCEKLLEKLCTKSDNCPLFLAHRICSRNYPEASPADRIIFYQEYITCKLKILEHHFGLKLLLTNKCPCSEEMVAAVIRALNEVLAFYKAACGRSEQQHRLHTLINGVHLLHALAQGDIFFAQHHSRVQVIYVRLVIELERLFRHLPQDYELILLMLEELNDFDLEPADASQDMDTDDK